MDLDSDLFAEEAEPVVNHVRGRFQPKAKPRPTKERPVPVGVVDKDNNLLESVAFSEPASEAVRTVEQLKVNESSEHALHSEVTVTDGCGDIHSSFEKELGQNADILFGLESLSDFPSQPTNGTEMPSLIVSDYNGGEGVAVEGQSSVNNSAPGQEEAFSDMNSLDFTSEGAAASGPRVAKYKPRPQVRSQSEKRDISLPHPDSVETVIHSPNALFVSSGTQCMSEGLIPASVPEDCCDYSSIDLGGTTPDHTSSEIPVDEELTNISGISQTDAVAPANIQHVDFPAMTEAQNAIDKKRKASTGPSLSQRLIESSQAGEKVELGKLLKQLRKDGVVPELFDEADEAHGDGSVIAEPSSTAADQDEVDVDLDGNRVEKTSKKKRAPKKMKKPTENEKPARKRKKANEASDKSEKAPPKKFSHSTRRKRRIVSKELLQTPEDEIDPQKVPMKDLILLAEYKERIAIKEAKATTTPLANQSAEHSSREEDYHNEDETFASEEGFGSFSDQAADRVQPRVHYYNYQSFMKKTPTVRWSKQETELFYEAIRQFGTDLSMIQQLFPGRTRQQVKLKYKKEEREHPLRLTEALTNRAKDHSHFEKVIEQLQQVAAQAARKHDDSAGMTDEDVEELNPDHNDKAEKTEQDENVEAEVNEVHSPQKADESDDDEDIWNSYKSEF